MTTNSDNSKLRFGESVGRGVSEGVDLSTGFQDPTGEFPRREYFNSTNLNFAATGGKRNDLYIGGADENVPLNLGTPVASEYPYNQVSETVSGHVIEIDDTPGNERVLIMHRTKGGVELRNDGTVIISSTKNRVEVVGDDHTVIVEGEGNLVYKGNLNLKVTGDFNVDCLNFNVNARGNKTENITGASRSNVGGNLGFKVTGSFSNTVVGGVVDTYLSGHSHNVKGTYSTNVDGAANIVSSGDMTLTSESQTSISTPDMNMVASSLSVFGATGTVGGQGVVMYGQGATFEEGVTAPTFTGDLEGKANYAAEADHALGADKAAATGNTSPSFISPVATPTTAKPTEVNVTTYLNSAAAGIRKVKIDVGDFIKNFIDKSTAYAGISKTPLTPSKARSKLRDPANRGNAQFVNSLIADKALSPKYAAVTPTGLGRVVSKDDPPATGNKTIGSVQTETPNTPVKVKKGKVTITPDLSFNPDLLDPRQKITMSTKLAPGVSIAKFFGSSGDSVSLDYLRSDKAKAELARYLYLHSQFIRSIQTDDEEFANNRIVVAEGVYKPGPAERVTPDTINDWKTKGRAIVYDLVDEDGKSDPEKIFDLAVYWKDTQDFQKMILSYDNYDPDGEIKARIIIILPEVSEDWEATFAGDISTEYNNNVVAEGELVECLDYKSTSSNENQSGGPGSQPEATTNPFTSSADGLITYLTKEKALDDYYNNKGPFANPQVTGQRPKTFIFRVNEPIGELYIAVSESNERWLYPYTLAEYEGVGGKVDAKTKSFDRIVRGE